MFKEVYSKVFLKLQSPNFMILSRLSSQPKNRLQLSAGLNLETLNIISRGANHI